jgi:hypothetical protein
MLAWQLCCDRRTTINSLRRLSSSSAQINDPG